MWNVSFINRISQFALCVACLLFITSATYATDKLLVKDATGTNEEKWKLYVNDTYHYEIIYPPSAILDASKPQEVYIRFKEPFYMSEHSQGITEIGITIRIHANPKHLTAKEWASKIEPDLHFPRFNGHTERLGTI